MLLLLITFCCGFSSGVIVALVAVGLWIARMLIREPEHQPIVACYAVSDDDRGEEVVQTFLSVALLRRGVTGRSRN